MAKTDEALLSEFTAGQSAALGELARRYEAALLGIACGLLGGRRDLAMDAVQETWVRVVRFAGKFDARSSFKTWVYRIVVNQCRDLGRMAARATDVALEQSRSTDDIRQSSNEIGGDDDSAATDPALAAEKNELNGNVAQAVAALAGEKREILLLCYHKRMTHSEAAEVLDIPVGTLKSRLHAALSELRERLGAEKKD